MTSKKRLTLKILLFLISTDILETLAQFCFKKSVACQAVILSPYLWIGLISVFTIFVIWSTILSKIDLSVAVPVASFSYVLVPLASSVFLHEKISSLRWLGIIFILIGVIFVSISTGHHKEEKI